MPNARAWVAQRWRSLPLQVAAVLVIAAALTPAGMQLLVTREVGVGLTVARANPCWALTWQPAGKGPRNGHWIDLADETRRSDDAVRDCPPIHFTRRVPTGALQDISLEWRHSRYAEVRIDEVVYTTRLFGRSVLHREHDALERAAVSGGTLQSGVLRTEADDGAVSFPPVTRRATDWAIVAGVLAAAGVGVLLLARAAWRGAGLLQRWIDRARPEAFSFPDSRAAAIPFVLVSLAIPLWFHLWAPTIITGDGSAYAWTAHSMLREFSLRWYDAWRLPGYSFLLMPFVGLTRDWAEWVGWAQGLIGLGGGVATWLAIRGRVPRFWACCAVVLIVIDPALLVWQRTIMSETLTAFLLSLIAAVVWTIDRALTRRATVTHMLALAGALGVIVGYATWTRANLQLGVVLLPPTLAAVGLLRGLRWRSLIPAGACLLCAGLTLAPLVSYVNRAFGRPAVVIGPGFNKALWSWQNRTTDFNQVHALTFFEFREVRRQVHADLMNDWAFVFFITDSPTIPMPPGTHKAVARDVRNRLIVEESFARQPDRFLAMSAKAWASLAGFQVRDPWYFKDGSRWLTAEHLAEPQHYPTTLHELDRARFTPEVLSMLERSERPSPPFLHSGRGRLMRAWTDVFSTLRPIHTALVMLGVLLALRRRDAATVGLGLLVLANQTAVHVLVYSGEDRFAMPFFALGWAVAAVGILGRQRGWALGTPRTGQS